MNFSNLTGISIWDVRNAVNRVKNAVMNYTEMEIKINEATGPEPWGAPRTLMMEIAQATNTSSCSEIINYIFVKFEEQDQSLWRQVYKALQLLEYLLKNGSELVISEVNQRISVLRALRNFNYVDSNGTDRGINIKFLSKEIVNLLNNPQKLQDDRAKARENRNKYTGVSSEIARSGFNSSSVPPTTPTEEIGRNRSKANGSRRAEQPKANSSRNIEQSKASSSRHIEQSKANSSKHVEQSKAKSAKLFDNSFDKSSSSVDLGELLSFDEPIPVQKGTNDAKSNWTDDDFGDFVSAKPETFKQNSSLLDDEWTDFQGATEPLEQSNINNSDLLSGIEPLQPNFNTTTLPNILAPISLNKETGNDVNTSSNNLQPSTNITKPKNPNDLWAQHESLISLDSLSLGPKK
ncbi:hypothetical protein BB559_005207 [Furculomyces boomerangus]|uniref:ENTH domain-containing protein n=1 Tax=Furculomyces boomerangus TaxID=61424 RepID=A0A2T9YA48_9FUNG|nr:hypothetical protein BB559_005207 [Furculomyces boomerangus]